MIAERAPLKVYIAGKYEAQARLKAIREKLSGLPVLCTSNWLDQVFEPAGGVITIDKHHEMALSDVRDICQSDLIILDTFDDSNTGGRDWEAGLLFGLTQRFWLVGPMRNIFHTLAQYKFIDWQTCLVKLEEETK